MKIGEGPWGCIAVFAAIGFMAIVYLITIAIIWLINHISITY